MHCIHFGTRSVTDSADLNSCQANSKHWRARLVGLLVLGICSLSLARVQADNPASAPITRLTYSDPAISLRPPVRKLRAEYLPVWKKALDHSEADLRRQIANSIEIAHVQGYRDMTEFSPKLTKVLAIEALPQLVRVDVAKALVALDAKEAMPELTKWLGTSKDYDFIVQPALARWQSTKFLDTWLSLVSDPKALYRDRLLAVRCLRLLKQVGDTKPLIRIVESKTEKVTYRIEAAITLAHAGPKDAVAVAESLIKSSDKSLAQNEDGQQHTLARLLAAKLLTGNQSTAAQLLNESLATDKRPLVVAAVWPRLLKTKPAALVSLAEQRISDLDSQVRLLSVEVLTALPSVLRIDLIASRLGDRNQLVRAAARDALILLAGTPDKPFKDPVVRASESLLHKNDWRAQEQAVIVLAKLDHDPAASKIVPLLKHNDAEVAVAAAWGLRVIANASSYPPMLRHANRVDLQVQQRRTSSAKSQQLAHLFEAFGQADYRPAESLIRQQIPKVEIRYPMEEARAAAVWAMGKFYANTKDAQLAQTLLTRLNDIDGLVSEFAPVRFACTISLGRIGNKSVISDLETIVAGGRGRVAMGSSWALNKIDGRPFVLPAAKQQGRAWVLAPIDRKQTKSK